ncbi:type VI secretion system Vgr family protein [Roseomonas sp. CCTCC AB2023176]|uniref:type VI secretion system Vgr family protein n=1 Tax=Roseomonas sp. CCTCC AB2023176 TaxID=3342640 RepID=UPI0035DB74DC
MSASIKTNRLLAFRSAIDADFTPIAFNAQESLSVPYQLRLDVLSPVGNLKPDDILYRTACLSLQEEGVPMRHFHGLIRRVSLLGGDFRNNWRYALEIVPRLWFLSQTQDCRVFVKQTAEQILRALLNECDIDSVEFRVFGEKQVREYTVQMNETDLSFATRLMQEEGWFYFFEHSERDHHLVIADGNAAFGWVGADQAAREVEVRPSSAENNALANWCPTEATTHGLVCLRDYDPETPHSFAVSNLTKRRMPGADKRDVFRWPAMTTDRGEADRRSRFLIEAAEAHSSLVDGTGETKTFSPGHRFILRQDPHSGERNKTYVLQTVVHEGREDVSRNTSALTGYTNSFSAFRADVPWRERLTIAKPIMHGIFSAVVIGPAGSEIHTDRLGRIQIRFPWDHRKDSQADMSIWVRVIQPWAGKGWGTQFIPRVGTEVAVGFVDGDIDRPVVIGGLYNGSDPYPFTPPAQRSKSGIRTRSTPEGGSSEYNELSFDDEKGKELVFLQAQRDLEVNVKRNETATIGANQTETIGDNRTTTIERGDDTLHLKKGSRSTAIDEGDDDTVVSMGDLSITTKLGSVTVEAMKEITLKVGSSSIVISQQGIALEGLVLSVEGKVRLGLTAPMTQVEAAAIVAVKGGLITLN